MDGFNYVAGKGFDFVNKNLSKEHRSNVGKLGNKSLQNRLKSDKDFNDWFVTRMSEVAKNRHAEGTLKSWKDNYSWLGKKHKEESKKKIGEKNSIHQKGSGNSQYGTMWITNGIENNRIKKNDTIPEGWRKGRVIKNIP